MDNSYDYFTRTMYQWCINNNKAELIVVTWFIPEFVLLPLHVLTDLLFARVKVVLVHYFSSGVFLHTFQFETINTDTHKV